jgi:uncharacterized protein involved in exopolysaccharide biosynthesis
MRLVALWKALNERKNILFWCSVLALALAGTYYSVSARGYESRARMLISGRKDLPANLHGAGPLNGLLALFKRVVAEQTSEADGNTSSLEPDDRDGALLLSVTSVGGTANFGRVNPFVLEIRYRARDPEGSQKIVQSSISAFRAQLAAKTPFEMELISMPTIGQDVTPRAWIVFPCALLAGLLVGSFLAGVAHISNGRRAEARPEDLEAS